MRACISLGNLGKGHVDLLLAAIGDRPLAAERNFLSPSHGAQGVQLLVGAWRSPD